MAIPDKKIKSNPQGPGTQGKNNIAARDARARARRGDNKPSKQPTGRVSGNLGRTPSTRPGRELPTPEGDARYNSVEDRWARLTGTGRYANTPEMNWARMTGTGEWADGGGGETRLNRERMFGAARRADEYRAGAPARRERALEGLADFRQETGANSVGKKLATRTARVPKRDEYINPAFRNRRAFPGMGG